MALCLSAPALSYVALETPAYAQMEQGQIQGRITDKNTGRALPGVTVVVSGPALQADQTEFTDADGHYLVTQLPPGDNYMVRYYFNDVIVERPGVRVKQGVTLTQNLAMETVKVRKVTTIIERAPSVDTASTAVTQEINQEVLQNTAVRGRTYESVLALAPGAVDPPRGQGGDIGVSFGGSTGNENSFLIDGLNTTDPNLGLIATQLHPYFIKEINVITGGYQAEYGRATGGVVSVVTKSGGNEFHGSVFGSWEPFQLEQRTVARLGEAIGTKGTRDQRYDFGFELGGPIVKDRVWFYVGFAPTFTNLRTDRVIRTQTYDPTLVNPTTGMTVGGAAVDKNYACPGYLSTPDALGQGEINPLCFGPAALAKQTTEGRSLRVNRYQRQYNWVAKLQFNINPDHNIQLGYIGSPNTYDGYASTGYRDLGTAKYETVDQIHDVTARYVGKLLDRKLQIEVLYGFHYQGHEERPLDPTKRETIWRAPGTNPFSLADFEDWKECQRTQVQGPNGTTVFNPCPITSYGGLGFGAYTPSQTLQRHVVMASATYYLRLLGSHAWKLGFDFEDNLSDHKRTYSGTDWDPNNPLAGHIIFRTNATGTNLQIYRAYQQKDATNLYGDKGVLCGQLDPVTKQQTAYCYNYFRAQTEARNFSVYLRDQWNVGFVPGLMLNLGVRWEGQEIFGVSSTTDQQELFANLYGSNKPIAVYDNWAPRFGAVYDFTRKGRSKLYVNYGRFYESIPLNIADRAFSGEGLLVGVGSTNTCVNRNLQPGGRPVPVPEAGPGSPCNIGTTPNNSAGNYAPVAPGLKGQYINEVVAGIQYDVGLDIVLGAGYIYRNFGNIIEDLSVDGGNNYFIANPGAKPDDGLVKQLQDNLDSAQRAATADPTNAKLAANATLAEQKLQVYKAAYTFPTAVREYHALQLTANKRLSNRFSLLANYTFSRLVGNYPGTFSATNGQLDPNISTQYDIIDLLINRKGPLPNDRPHNFKLTGFYTQPIGSKGTLVAGLTFTLFSGRPVQVLGAHPVYGPDETFILPTGAGGRTPMVTQFDLHVGYEHQLSKLVRMSLAVDVINLFNQREITNIDDEYTGSSVLPILNGKLEDLKHLKTADGTPLVPNSNYGNPTAFQEPLYMRFSGRLSF